MRRLSRLPRWSADNHCEGVAERLRCQFEFPAGIARGIVLIGLLSEVMARTLETGLAGTGAPPILAPLVVATISASPEILTALRAALSNRMQPVVNIALGASLSTVVRMTRSTRPLALAVPVA